MADIGKSVEDIVGIEEIRKVQNQFLALMNEDYRRDFRREIELQVDAERIATDSMLLIEPFQELVSPGRWLKQGSDYRYETYRHGFDRKGRVVLVDSGAHPRYYRHERERLEEVSFCHASGEPWFVAHHYFANGQLSHTLSARHSGSYLDSHLDLDNYVRDEGRLLYLETYKGYKNWLDARDPIAMAGKLEIYHDRYHEFEYDEHGILERVSMYGRTVYQRPEKGMTVASLAKRLEKSLIDLIPNRVRSADVPDQLWCIFIKYLADSGQRDVPPSLCLASAKERDDLFPEEAWYPDEYPEWTRQSLHDDSLYYYWQLWAQMSYESENPPEFSQTEILRKVAKALNKLNWTEIVPCTPSFFVVPVDTEGFMSITEDLRASVPRRTRESLAQAGYFDDVFDSDELIR